MAVGSLECSLTCRCRTPASTFTFSWCSPCGVGLSRFTPFLKDTSHIALGLWHIFFGGHNSITHNRCRVGTLWLCLGHSSCASQLPTKTLCSGPTSCPVSSDLIQFQGSSFCSLPSPTSFLVQGFLRSSFLLLEQVAAPLAPTHPVGLSLNITAPSEASLDPDPPTQTTPLPRSLCCSLRYYPGFLFQLVLIESLVRLLFRNYIYSVYLAHSKSPVVSC